MNTCAYSAYDVRATMNHCVTCTNETARLTRLYNKRVTVTCDLCKHIDNTAYGLTPAAASVAQLVADGWIERALHVGEEKCPRCDLIMVTATHLATVVPEGSRNVLLMKCRTAPWASSMRDGSRPDRDSIESSMLRGLTGAYDPATLMRSVTVSDRVVTVGDYVSRAPLILELAHWIVGAADAMDMLPDAVEVGQLYCVTNPLQPLPLTCEVDGGYLAPSASVVAYLARAIVHGQIRRVPGGNTVAIVNMCGGDMVVLWNAEGIRVNDTRVSALSVRALIAFSDFVAKYRAHEAATTSTHMHS